MGLLLRRHHDGTDGVTTASDVSPEATEPPAMSANKPEWEAYARSQGVNPDGLTKDEIIDQVGGDA